MGGSPPPRYTSDAGRLPSIHLVSPNSMFRHRLNSVEPPWYVTRMSGGVGGAALRRPPEKVNPCPP